MEAATTVEAPRPLSRRLAFLFILVAAQVLVAFALLEFGARILDPYGISYYPSTAAYMDTMILEEPIGYRNQPNLKGTYFTQPVTINSLGLRQPDLALAPDPTRYRILLLGDSVVFGVGVADSDTLPAQLATVLKDRVGEINGREVEVINMGCISYNSEQELVQYKQLGAKLKPDLVLLMFSSNDIEPKMWIFEKRSNPLVALGQRSYAVSTLLIMKRKLENMVMGSKPLIQYSSYRKGHPRWQAIDSSLSTLNQLTASDNVPFVVFTTNTSGAEWMLLSETAQREGFPLRPVIPFEDVRWKHLDPADYWAKGGGYHANREGLAMYTTLIYEEVDALGLLGTKRSNPPGFKGELRQR